MNDYDEAKLLKKIKVMFDESLEVKLDEKLDEKFKYKFGNLPTKDQFYEETLKVLTKLDSIETQMTMLSGRTYDNTDKIEKLQKIHPHNSHPTFA
jgi:hypothetical protein